MKLFKQIKNVLNGGESGKSTPSRNQRQSISSKRQSLSPRRQSSTGGNSSRSLSLSPQRTSSNTHNKMNFLARNSPERVKSAIKRKKEFTKEGSMNFRLLAFAGGVAMIFTSMESLGLCFYAGDYIKVLVYLYNLIFGFIICIIEGHFIKFTIVQNTRQNVIDFVPALRYLWGRGVFYAFSGLLQLSELSPANILSGLFLVVVGVLFIGIGWSTKQKLSKLKKCLQNPNKLKKQFKKYDRDGDNVLDRDEFGELIVAITGEAMDEDDLEGIFAVMDSNGNDYVTLEELLTWWKGFEANAQTEEHGGYDLM